MGGVQPQNGDSMVTCWVFLGILGFLIKKGVERAFLNIPDNLWTGTKFVHFFKGISSGSDKEYF